MDFESTQLGELKELFEEQQSKGNVFVVYYEFDDDYIFNKDMFTFFNTKDETIHFEVTENEENYNEPVYTRLTELVLQKIERQIQREKELINQKIETMKQENLDYLMKQVKAAGLGEDLAGPLKEKMESNEAKFELKQPVKIGSDEVDTTSYFRKSATNDNYYFNSYEVALKQEQGKPETKQTFYVGRENNYTVEESNNLLNHRFVNKDLVNEKGEGYNSWVKIDFKETLASGNYKMKYFGEKWGFDLEKALEKRPEIKELANEASKAELIASLKKGNKQEITLVRDGEEKKGFVAANAYGRSVTVTDENNQLVRTVQVAKEGQSQTPDQKPGQKTDQKQEGENKPRNTRRNTQKQDTAEGKKPSTRRNKAHGVS
jgi:hypothetical protein